MKPTHASCDIRNNQHCYFSTNTPPIYYEAGLCVEYLDPESHLGEACFYIVKDIDEVDVAVVDGLDWAVSGGLFYAKTFLLVLLPKKTGKGKLRSSSS